MTRIKQEKQSDRVKWEARSGKSVVARGVLKTNKSIVFLIMRRLNPQTKKIYYIYSIRNKATSTELFNSKGREYRSVDQTKRASLSKLKYLDQEEKKEVEHTRYVWEDVERSRDFVSILRTHAGRVVWIIFKGDQGYGYSVFVDKLLSLDSQNKFYRSRKAAKLHAESRIREIDKFVFSTNIASANIINLSRLNELGAAAATAAV